MERLEWLKHMRCLAEALYDQISPAYWVYFGFYDNQAHQDYLKKFIQHMPQGGTVLSAGCGAGRYDGLLLEAGQTVTGIDQSEGMLERARAHFPPANYEKLGLLEINIQAEFDGVTCIDALEHVPPEDWPVIAQNFYKALKPGGWLYLTVDRASKEELDESYQQSMILGLPAVYGEVVDRVESAYVEMQERGEETWVALSDPAVYHYYPPLEQVRSWLGKVGFMIEEESFGSGYQHFLARKSP
jgi:SAM-dependent methyltransferase